MTIDFRDYFWGEKHNGFEVLYQNMKSGHLATKEFTDFVKERSFIEENTSKLLTKLSKQANNNSIQGTFIPLWKILKSSTEKLSSLHMQMVYGLQELVKELLKYNEEQSKRQKQMKTEELVTLEVVGELKDTIAGLNKAKEFYNSKVLEYEKLKRENGSQKDIEKAEIRLNKSCTDYKQLIDKYSTVKEEFESKLSVSCQHFQQLEEQHIKQMKDFLANFYQVLESGHTLIGQVHIEFKQNCNEMTVNKLLEQFVATKGTGHDRPEVIVFEETNTSTLSATKSSDLLDLTTNGEKGVKKEGKHNLSNRYMKSKPYSRRTTSLLDIFRSTSSAISTGSDLRGSGGDYNEVNSNKRFDANGANYANCPPNTLLRDHHKSSPNIKSEFTSRNTFRSSKWFLRSKREKVKEKKKKKKSTESSKEDNSSVDTSKDSNSIDLPIKPPNSDNPVVDDEGYIIRPNFGNQSNSDNHFYSSSDSESEEEKEQKIRIKINPLTNGAPISASVDELIASAGTLSLSPLTIHSRRRPDALTLRLKNRRVYTTSTSPTPEDGPIKRSISANHNISKAENDLISVFSSSLSSASTPSGIANQMQTNSKNSSMNSNSNSINNLHKNPSADRYAALSDLFTESINESTSVLSKSMSASIIGPPVLTSLPRPASKRNPQTSPQLSHQSSHTSTISRCESVSSLSSDFRMTPISVGSSRGPSPLTLGISDAVPLAIALQESVSACFKGLDETKCQVQVIGSLKMAFPAGIVQAFANNPYPSPLTFKLNKSSKLEKIFPNKELLIENCDSLRTLTNDSFSFEVNMTALLSNIRRLYEQSPNSRYYNIDVLKYQIRCNQGAKSTPLQLVSYWKCDPQSTNLKIDYKFNGNALAQVEPLRNVSIWVNVDGEPNSMQSRPDGKWNGSTKQGFWRFEQISNTCETGGQTTLAGLGSIKAKFDLLAGPSNPSVVQAQFTCLDTTMSGLDFELTGMGYRVSLIKRQVSSGRYICEA